MRIYFNILIVLILTGKQVSAQSTNKEIILKIEELNLDEPNDETVQELSSILTSEYQVLNRDSREQYYTVLLECLYDIDRYRQAEQISDTLISLYQDVNSEEVADVYVFRSIIYDALGSYPEALQASQKALSIYNILNIDDGKATCYNDIGVLHYYRGEDSLAREYLNQSFEIYHDLQDSAGMAQYYNNMANTLFDTDQLTEAIEMYSKGLEIDRANNDLEGQSISLSNIGETYTALEEYELAEKTLLESLAFAEEFNDSWTISNPLRGLGDLYQIQGKTEEAIATVKRSVELCSEIGALAELAIAYYQLYDLYFEQKDFEEAISYHELYHIVNDSLFNIDKETIFGDMEMQYQVQDKAQKLILAKKNKEIDDIAHEKEIDEEHKRQTFLFIGLGCFALVLLFTIRSILQKKKANAQLSDRNNIIEDKNKKIQHAYEEIEEKSKEILDSINYAKRIQTAILPTKKLIKEYLSDNFILYKPKDIVAGDFYWMEPTKDGVIFAAADCTGHGVPGAMVSVVCHNSLNRSVREFGLTEPGPILEKTRELVIAEFEKSEEDVKDGMDIALCSLKQEVNCWKLKYAGANNPLWIVRNGKLLETKADKQPIGAFGLEELFTTHSFEMQEGDTLYISTDGFQDQFGGKKGKKFKSSQFKEFLLSIQEHSMERQHELLDQEFEKWRGELEQIDDVCLIGVRV